MSYNQEHIDQLWRQYLSSTASNEQVKELFDAISDEHSGISNDWLYERFLQVEQQQPHLLKSYDGPDELLQQIIDADPDLQRALKPKQPRMRRLATWGWAAAILMLLVAGLYYFTPRGEQVLAAIKPGGNGAILTLGDGTTVVLDSIGNGPVASQQGTNITLTNGHLTYGSGKTNNQAAVYNTVTTPFGRQFNLTLPDGSEVWLNAGSAIRFPTVFSEKHRRVEITGEAYFEVRHDEGKPFLVAVDNRATIEVLGTHFNVSAYDNERETAVTLLEGSVDVNGNVQGHAVLRPRQQAALPLHNGAIRVINEVDVSRVIAWKNGLFDFNEVNLGEAMRQLERWYNVEVVFPGGVPDDVELSGKITKGVTLNELVEVLGRVGLKCRLEGRQLIVLR